MCALTSLLPRWFRRSPLLLAAVIATSTLAQPLPIEHLVGLDEYEDVRLSPTGEYLALTVPFADRTALAMVRLSDGQQLGSIQHGRGIYIDDFEWVGPDRIIYSIGERFGRLKAPQSTGELFAVGVDGKQHASLIGFRAGKGTSNFSHIKRAKSESVFARLVAPLADDPKSALISVQDLTGRELPFSRVERIDVRTGSRIVAATAPVANARFLTDHANRVRFAWGSDTDNVQHVYQRDHDQAEWRLLNDESVSGRRMFPLAFSTDNRTAYLQVEETSGPDGLYTVVDGRLTEQPVARDDDTDVHRLLLSPFDRAPFAVAFLDGLPRIEYLEPEGELTRLHRSLQASFPGQSVLLGQASSDGRLGLIVTHSDRNPGDVYLFEFASKKAIFVMARNQRIDPEQMAAMRPFRFTARDGTPLNGYLTLPPGGPEKNLPLVVHPHGGPIGERDEWRFDATVQWLAANGYAVLQVNFRGSGGYGRAFLLAGYREWGRAMQDDLTDATRWAIAEGIADPDRICIHGASYGGYAALMGAAKEPGLYRCASGHVGVYDLPMIFSTGNTAGVRWAQNYYEAAIGRDDLESYSPNRLAGRIRIPVLLTAGDQDEVAPVAHTRAMDKALRAAGGEVTTHVYRGEGHGLFVETNRIDHYRRLAEFLHQHIGTSVGTADPTQAASD